jgi:hypothetical protein
MIQSFKARGLLGKFVRFYGSKNAESLVTRVAAFMLLIKGFNRLPSKPVHCNEADKIRAGPPAQQYRI